MLGLNVEIPADHLLSNYHLFFRIKSGEMIFRKAKPIEVINFYNNMESVWDHVVKINKCFKLDRKTEYFVTAGSADKLDNPVEAIANCALDMMDAGHRALINPATGKPVQISVS